MQYFKPIKRENMGHAIKKTGQLFVIATPIGNLEDISIRALNILNSVDLIVAEDTRRARKLMNKFFVSCPLTSYHEYNKQKKAPEIIQKILAGKNLALISDAGTPCISDPGYYLISLALSKSVEIIPVPGPCAAVASLSVCGLPTDRFVFEGFLDARKTKRIYALERLKEEERTIILFESPYRLIQTLEAILNVLGNRKICVARELTKVHEEIVRGDVESVLSIFKGKKSVKGELTLVIQGIGKKGKKKRIEKL